jgi:2-polyprenyl-3-methyl-5-hydroxy-6-metoxy-1,4-benzoquinol methylase
MRTREIESPGADARILQSGPGAVYRDELILRHVVGKDVLDCGIVGGGDYWRRHLRDVWLHGRIARRARTSLGVDIQSEEIDAIRGATGFDVSYADVEALTFPERFDVVVAGELVEHLHNIGLFLDGAWRSLRDGGLLLITTPNNFRLSSLLYALVLGREICHPEHSCYFSSQTIRYVLAQHGFTAEVIGIPEPSRFRVVTGLYKRISAVRPILSQTLFVVGRKCGQAGRLAAKR